jgi:hypothetical protein
MLLTISHAKWSSPEHFEALGCEDTYPNMVIRFDYALQSGWHKWRHGRWLPLNLNDVPAEVMARYNSAMRHKSGNEGSVRRYENRRELQSGGLTVNDDIIQQTVVENCMLKILVEGLRSALAWKVTNAAFSRKLSSVRFITQSFQRHLERLMALKEYDGYMDRLAKKAPQLTRAVGELKQEHEAFRTRIRRILLGLEHVSSTDYATFANLCDELLTLLTNVDEHRKKEANLYHEAFEQDAGGEG